LRILGRVDDVIISGGLKVPPHVVEQQLLLDPRITAAAVLGIPDEEWGERVVAVVTLSEALDLEELRGLVTPREWAPRQLVVADLPLLPNGKPDRVAVRRLVTRG
jgi:O-succinylbenzoic acid--CoA ligase